MTTTTAEARWIPVAAVEDVRDGRKVVRVEDRQIAIFKIRDRFYAVDNRCPHMGYPLSQGSVKDTTLTCDWHNWKFELDSGTCTSREGGEDVRAYTVKVEDGRILLDLADEPVEELMARHLKSLRFGLFLNAQGRIARDAARLLSLGMLPAAGDARGRAAQRRARGVRLGPRARRHRRLHQHGRVLRWRGHRHPHRARADVGGGARRALQAPPRTRAAARGPRWRAGVPPPHRRRGRRRRRSVAAGRDRWRHRGPRAVALAAQRRDGPFSRLRPPDDLRLQGDAARRDHGLGHHARCHPDDRALDRLGDPLRQAPRDAQVHREAPRRRAEDGDVRGEAAPPRRHVRQRALPQRRAVRQGRRRLRSRARRALCRRPRRHRRARARARRIGAHAAHGRRVGDLARRAGLGRGRLARGHAPAHPRQRQPPAPAPRRHAGSAAQPLSQRLVHQLPEALRPNRRRPRRCRAAARAGVPRRGARSPPPTAKPSSSAAPTKRWAS